MLDMLLSAICTTVFHLRLLICLGTLNHTYRNTLFQINADNLQPRSFNKHPEFLLTPFPRPNVHNTHIYHHTVRIWWDRYQLFADEHTSTGILRQRIDLIAQKINRNFVTEPMDTTANVVYQYH